MLAECQSSVPKVEFVFLVGNEILLSTLGEHLTERGVTSESLEIEYFEKQTSPTFHDSIQQEDLISSVKRFQNYVLTGCYDGTLQIWTAENSRRLVSKELEDRVKCVEWLSVEDGIKATFVSGGFDQNAQLWVWDMKLNEVRCAAVCRGHSETVMTIAAQSSPYQRTAETILFATGSWDGTVKLWSASPEATDLSVETGGIKHKPKSKDKIPTRIPQMTLAGHREVVTRVCWLPSAPPTPGELSGNASKSPNQLASVSWDHTLRVWDCQVGNGVEVRCIVSSHALHDADAAVLGVLTASSDNRVRIFDLRAQEALAVVGFQGHTGWLTSVAWAPHRSDQFVTGSIDRSVRLWDTRNTRASLYDLIGHTDIVTDVDWSPALRDRVETSICDGHIDARHYILSSSGDGTVKIYNYVE